jgi:hypothetical protein
MQELAEQAELQACGTFEQSGCAAGAVYVGFAHKQHENLHNNLHGHD